MYGLEFPFCFGLGIRAAWREERRLPQQRRHFANLSGNLQSRPSVRVVSIYDVITRLTRSFRLKNRTLSRQKRFSRCLQEVTPRGRVISKDGAVGRQLPVRLEFNSAFAHRAVRARPRRMIQFEFSRRRGIFFPLAAMQRHLMSVVASSMIS